MSHIITLTHNHGTLTPNTWLWLTDDQALPTTGDIIVSLARYQTDETLKSHTGKLGVRIPNTLDIETEGAALLHLPLIAVDFPGYRDGRAYSQARVLRSRLGYTGDIRAMGEVVRDQLQLMIRCGVSSYELRADQDVAASLASLHDFSAAYQASSDGFTPVLKQRLA